MTQLHSDKFRHCAPFTIKGIWVFLCRLASPEDGLNAATPQQAQGLVLSGRGLVGREGARKGSAVALKAIYGGLERLRDLNHRARSLKSACYGITSRGRARALRIIDRP